MEVGGSDQNLKEPSLAFYPYYEGAVHTSLATYLLPRLELVVQWSSGVGYLELSQRGVSVSFHGLYARRRFRTNRASMWETPQT